MVTLRVVFGLGVGLLITKIKTGAGFFRTLFYLPYLAPPVAATMAFAFLLNPGTGPVNTSSSSFGIPAPGLVQRPHVVQARADPAGAVGHRRPDGHLHGRAARRAQGAVRGGGARRRRRWQRFRYVTLPNISPILMFAVVTGVIQTMQYYTQPLVAGKVASGVIDGAGHAVRARLPRQSTLTFPSSSTTWASSASTSGSACVVALVLFALVHGVHRALMRRRAGFLPADD